MHSVVAWFTNERRKRAWEEYERKEQNYKAILVASQGYYVATEDRARITEFLEPVNLCWLHCPDSVIHKTYAFLNTVKPGANGPSADLVRPWIIRGGVAIALLVTGGVIAF